MQMEGMVTDLQLAKEKQADFERWKRDNNRQLPVEMSVTVLTTGFWPTYKVTARASRQSYSVSASHAARIPGTASCELKSKPKLLMEVSVTVLTTAWSGLPMCLRQSSQAQLDVQHQLSAGLAALPAPRFHQAECCHHDTC